VLDELKIDRADLVTHDIGNMVGYAFAAQNLNRPFAGHDRYQESNYLAQI
jgi:hypothetical protein